MLNAYCIVAPIVLYARDWPGFIFGGFSTLELETALLYPWPNESQNSYKMFIGGLLYGTDQKNLKSSVKTSFPYRV